MTQPLPHTHTPLPPAVTAAPGAAALLRALRRKWALALCLGLIAAADLAALVWLLVPIKYTATASVQVALPKQDSRQDLPTFLKAQAARLKSRDVLRRALNEEQARELKVSYAEGADCLNVSLHGEDREELVVLVNAVVKAYLDLVNGKEHAQSRERLARVHALAETAREKLAAKVAARQVLCTGQGAADTAALARKQQDLTRQLYEAQTQLDQVHLLLDKAQVRLAAAHKAGKRPVDVSVISGTAVETALEAEPAVKQNLVLMSDLRKLLGKMKAAGHPETESSYRQTKQRYDMVRREVEDRREALRKELLARQREKVRGDARALAEQLELEARPLETQQQKLAERVEALTRATATVNHAAARADLLSAEIQQEERQLAAVQDQLRDLQAAAEAEPRVALGQGAVWEKMHSGRRLALLVLVPLAGLGGVAAAVAWLECRGRRIHSTDEVAAGLGMRVVGAVPSLPGTPKQRCLIGEDPLDEIDSIRTLLLRGAGGPRVLMVTSAVAGEGKTTLSSNLALSLARAGRKTLLVDCDLRRPAAHQLFEQTLQPGLSEVLLAEVPLQGAVRPTTTDENLWLLPAGLWDREVVQGLARGLPKTVFEQLRQEFDFVVVDSHPVLPAADSLLIGQHVDAVIVSVMRGVSQAPRVLAACQRLAALGIKVFGAVVHNMPAEEHAGYGYQQPATVGR